MGVVDYEFYANVYGGTDADETSFPALCARASDVVGALTHWADDTRIITLPDPIPTLYKKAVCAQVDFFALNGLDSVNDSGNGGGFTVGKVTIHGATQGASGAGSMRASVSPLALMYLEQTGLMNPQVPTFEGWW